MHSNVNNVCSIILGGGRGTRLYPLVKERSKPAVPLGGKYRMIDIPISNCINSGLRNIYVLTQFKSASLNNHITHAYNFDAFTKGSVQVLAAEQTDVNLDWFQGSADAVRKHTHQIDKEVYEYILILSGDQIYRMNYMDLIDYMNDTGADIVVGTVPVKKSEAKSFGIMNVNAKGQIADFAEKPQEDEVLNKFKLSAEKKKSMEVKEKSKDYLASMGIYLFRKDVLLELLEDSANIDFGKDIIPNGIKNKKTFSYAFNGYWEDIGTIKAFFDANLALGDKNPPFDFYDQYAPIYTHARFLSGSKIENSSVEKSVIADGCKIYESKISRCMIGVRSIIRENSELENVVMMGADTYEMWQDKNKPSSKSKDLPWMGIGANCKIKNVILDKNVRIGDNVVITNEKKIKNMETALYSIRDGIVIIPKNTVIPSGTVV